MKTLDTPDPRLAQLEEKINRKVNNPELINILWSMVSKFLSKIPHHITLTISERFVTDNKINEIDFGYTVENHFVISKKRKDSIYKENNKDNHVFYSYADLLESFLFPWYSIRERQPKEDQQFLARLYGGFPSVVTKHKGKYYIPIPPKATGGKDFVYVEVTKGLDYWADIPPFFGESSLYYMRNDRNKNETNTSTK